MDSEARAGSERPAVLLVLWSGSAYDSLRAILRLAAGILTDMGCRVEAVTIGVDGWPERLRRLLEGDRFAFALGMSGVGSDLTLGDGALLWEAARTPFFDWCCDHPCYFPARHRASNPYLLHGYAFPDHAAYAASHLGQRRSTFPVHLGAPSRAAFPGAPVPLGLRERRIIFAKSGADPNRTVDRWRALPAPFGPVLLDAAEELATWGTTADVLPTLQRLAAPAGLILDGDCDVALGLVREIDAHLRFRRANLVLEALKPYPIDVYGSGWDHVDWSGSHAVHRGTLDFDAMAALLPRHLGSVSVNPLVDGSVHDRVSFALAAGVVPVGDANAFWRSRLPKLGAYGFVFDPASVAAAVEALLDDPVLALERAEAAQRGAGQNLSLEASVRRIVDVATAHRP